MSMVRDKIIDNLQGLYKELIWNTQQLKIKHNSLIIERCVDVYVMKIFETKNIKKKKPMLSNLTEM